MAEVNGVEIRSKRLRLVLDGRYLVGPCPWSGKWRWATSPGTSTEYGLPGHGASRSFRQAMDACRADLEARDTLDA